MKITIYELLGMIKDGKAPKKIKINEDILNLEIGKETLYRFEKGYGSLSFDYYIDNNKLDNKVEILDKNFKLEKENINYANYEILEEKKIPEKLETYKDKNNTIFLDDLCYKYMPIHKDSLSFNEQVIVDKLNEVLDYLKSKGDE